VEAITKPAIFGGILDIEATPSRITRTYLSGLSYAKTSSRFFSLHYSKVLINLIMVE
jgi:hypothetical protein